jgi:hypothetical protein
MKSDPSSRDAQTPHGGKVQNDHNKAGQQPTQKNEAQRTPGTAMTVSRR